MFECLWVFEWCLNDLTFVVSMCRYTPLDPVVEEYRALRVAENAAMAVEDALVRPIYAEERRVAKQELTHMAREDELMR